MVYLGGSTPARQSYINSLGQIWKEADPDGVITLFQYNAHGEREYTVGRM